MPIFTQARTRDRLRTALRRDTGESVLDPDYRPDDLVELDEAQASPDASSYGPSFPFGPSDVQVVAPVTTLAEQVELDIRSLLLTAPGETIGDPNFGVGARQFLFNSSIDSSADTALISRIQNQMETYYPSVKISNLRVFTVDDTKYVEMVVTLGATTVSVTV